MAPNPFAIRRPCIRCTIAAHSSLNRELGCGTAWQPAHFFLAKIAPADSGSGSIVDVLSVGTGGEHALTNNEVTREKNGSLPRALVNCRVIVTVPTRGVRLLTRRLGEHSHHIINEDRAHNNVNDCCAKTPVYPFALETDAITPEWET